MIAKQNYSPSNPIIIQIPKSTNQDALITYKDYFYYDTTIETKSRLKQKPNKIAVFWDASYSMKYRKIEYELKVLENYLEYLRNVEVNFIGHCRINLLES